MIRTIETRAHEVGTTVLIVGGGCGGVAAALALLHANVSCLLTEPTAMLGGQLTSQGVPPDENAWIDGRGPAAPASFRAGNATYLDLRERIRSHYRAHESLTTQASNNSHLNPGGGWVSRLCFEPRLAHDIILTMLREADNGRGLLTLAHGLTPAGADVEADLVRSVNFVRANAEPLTVHAELILDASETGDVLCIADVEHAIGSEARSAFGEFHAPEIADENDQQGPTWCFAVEHDPAREHVIDKPPAYERWRAYVPETDPPWTGPLFGWTVPSHNESGRITLPLIPPPDEPSGGALELWRYRRIVDARAHTDGRPDVALFNVVQMDQFSQPVLTRDGTGIDTGALDSAREQAACFLYWMQTEAPRHDTDARTGYPGLKRSGRSLASADGFALAPYIREPRRLRALITLTEAHFGADQRRADGVRTVAGTGIVPAERFGDVVAIGHYPIDLHPTPAGRNSIYVEASPFRIPLRSLVPVCTRNVLAAGKSLGVSHIANGATRLHPVEWAVGESAGVIAALCVREQIGIHALADDPSLVRRVQEALASRGVPLAWPWEDGCTP